VIQCPSSLSTVDPIGCAFGTHAKSAGLRIFTERERPLMMTRFSRSSIVSPGRPIIRLKNAPFRRESFGIRR
jgi:hypothetical protein